MPDNKTFVLNYFSGKELDFGAQELDKSVKIRPYDLHKSDKKAV